MNGAFAVSTVEVTQDYHLPFSNLPLPDVAEF
jgi:hypothetical protein